MGKRKVYNKSRMRSNKRSTKRKSTVKRTNTYKTKKSKKKKHRRKYNKSLKKTIKGGVTGVLENPLVWAGIAAGATGLGVAATAAGRRVYRNYRRRKNEVGEIQGIDTIDDDDNKSISAINKLEESSKYFEKLQQDLPGSVQSKSGEPKSKGEKYKDLLLDESMDESMDRIWVHYCPHYTTDTGYNIKEYKKGRDDNWYKKEHKVDSIEWKTREGDGWNYNITETYYFNDREDTDEYNTLLERDFSEVSVDRQNPNYQILENLLERLDLATEQNRLYLTKGTILISKIQIDWAFNYLECYGIIWSPIENTWRVIYGNLSDDNRLSGLLDSSNYNIKLDDFNNDIFKIYNIFGVNRLIAFKKLEEKVEFSVNNDDYLFGDDRLIKIKSVDWSIDEQQFDIYFFDFGNCYSYDTAKQFYVGFKLNEMSNAVASDYLFFYHGPDVDYPFNLINYIKIENKPKYGCFNTFEKTERSRLRKITTTLKITKISYDLQYEQFNYTISIDLKNDGNTQVITMLEEKLDAYITRNEYTLQHQP